MKKWTKTISLIFILIVSINFVGCNLHSPLLKDLSLDISNIESITLSDDSGNSVEVSNSEDFSFLSSYKKSGVLPEDREYEIFDTTKYTLCAINTPDGNVATFYLLNSGEIVCYLGEELKAKYYLYTTDNKKADSTYVKDLMKKYKYV